MAADLNFWPAMGNTFALVIVVVPLQVALALTTAVMIQKMTTGRDIVLWIWTIPLGISDLAAELLKMTPYLERYPSKLSGGQRQRVAVARALAVEPAVLLMDEPLSNLDALLRLEMRAELKAVLREAGTTTLYVTHDQTEAMGLADRWAPTCWSPARRQG
jgi:ABC-type molybdate transport system ATPase subunit